MNHINQTTGQAITVSQAISQGVTPAVAFANALDELTELVSLFGLAVDAHATLRAACLELADWQDAHPDKTAPALLRAVSAGLCKAGV